MLSENEFRELQEDVMRADLRLKERQAAWEVSKAIAGMVAAAAVFMGALLALETWRHPAAPQLITVHLDAPLSLAPRGPQ